MQYFSKYPSDLFFLFFPLLLFIPPQYPSFSFTPLFAFFFSLSFALSSPLLLYPPLPFSTLPFSPFNISPLPLSPSVLSFSPLSFPSLLFPFSSQPCSPLPFSPLNISPLPLSPSFLSSPLPFLLSPNVFFSFSTL